MAWDRGRAEAETPCGLEVTGRARPSVRLGCSRRDRRRRSPRRTATCSGRPRSEPPRRFRSWRPSACTGARSAWRSCPVRRRTRPRAAQPRCRAAPMKSTPIGSPPVELFSGHSPRARSAPGSRRGRRSRPGGCRAGTMIAEEPPARIPSIDGLVFGLALLEVRFEFGLVARDSRLRLPPPRSDRTARTSGPRPGWPRCRRSPGPATWGRPRACSQGTSRDPCGARTGSRSAPWCPRRE